MAIRRPEKKRRSQPEHWTKTHNKCIFCTFHLWKGHHQNENASQQQQAHTGDGHNNNKIYEKCIHFCGCVHEFSDILDTTNSRKIENNSQRISEKETNQQWSRVHKLIIAFSSNSILLSAHFPNGLQHILCASVFFVLWNLSVYVYFSISVDGRCIHQLHQFCDTDGVPWMLF